MFADRRVRPARTRMGFRMNKLIFAAAAAGALLLAGSASAGVLADFQLNGTLANSGPDGATLTMNGGVLGATGIEFGFNQGPTITGLGELDSYSLETRFSMAEVDGYRRIADFSDRASDDGLYVLDGDIDFYNQAFGPAGVIGANQLVTVKMTRAASGLVTGYINGVSQFSFVDTLGEAIIHDHVNLFLDDLSFANEATRGFVDYATISTFDGGVPEPATWALMILGFGSAGAMLRRRKSVLA